MCLENIYMYLYSYNLYYIYLICKHNIYLIRACVCIYIYILNIHKLTQKLHIIYKYTHASTACLQQWKSSAKECKNTFCENEKYTLSLG